MNHLIHNSDLFYIGCKNGNLDTVKSYSNAGKCVVYKDVSGNSPLLIACVHGHLSIVKFLLTIPECDVNFKNLFTDNAPLHMASLNGHETIVEELLNSSQCDVNCKNQAGNTPLHMASLNGHETIVEELLNSSQCDVNCKNRAGHTPLHMASLNGHETIVQKLVNLKECDVNCQNLTGDTPLHMASHKGCDGVMEELLNAADCAINCRNEKGNTALHIAIGKWGNQVPEGITELLLSVHPEYDSHIANKKGITSAMIIQAKYIKCIEKLLSNASCDPSIANSEGDTPLHIACQQGSLEIVDLLIGIGRKINLHAMNVYGKMPLHVANVQAIGCLMERGSYTFNEKDGKGNTVLHLAVQTENSKCVELLLTNASCDPNVVNGEGDTPLHIACQRGSFEIIDFLIGSDTLDLHLTNTHGTTPLHILFQMKYFAQISTLLEKCCSPSYVNREQIFQEAIDLAQACEIGSLLHLACCYGTTGIVEFFLGSSYCSVAAVNQPDVNGDTPLLIAARMNNVSMIKMLLACQGVDPNVKNAGGESALITACRSDCFECVQILTNYQDCDLNMQDNAGNTALHVAVERGNSELVNILLCNSSCNPNISGLEGDSPLHVSVKIKSTKCVKALLASPSCDPNTMNSDGNTPLHIACQQESVEIIDLFLSTEKLNLSQLNNKGNTVLHLAVQAKNRRCVEILLACASCDPNIANSEDDTPLLLSVKYEKTDCVKALLASASCDPNIVNSEGDTPLHIACQQGSVEIIDLFLSTEKLNLSQPNSKGDTLLHLAVQAKNRVFIKRLLACASCDPNIANSERDTPLHIACQQGYVEIIDLLLSNGADPNVKNAEGETALITACSSECFECVQILTNYQGCDLNKQDNMDNTALHVAVHYGNSELVSALLCNSSCNPNISGLDGDTPLHLSVKIENAECVKALLASPSCDPNTVNSEGDTPLHIACQEGSVEIIDLFLSTEKYSLSQPNCKGNTVLHLAVQAKSRVAVEKLLASASCNPNICNSEGNTPLHIACQQGSIEIIDLLLSIERKVNLHVMNVHGKMPLHVANLQAIEWLVEERYYSINEKDSKGNTVLHLAVQAKDRECVETLLASASCDPNVVNSQGDTPLHIACQQGSIEIIDLLVGSNKPDLHAHGKTLLRILFQMKCFAPISTLLEKCCSPIYVNREEMFQEAIDLAQVCEIGSLLHLACLYGSIGVVESFLGSSYCSVEAVNKPDVNGDTPLHIAAKSKLPAGGSIVQLLLAYDCIDPNVKNAGGETALIAACSAKCFDSAHSLARFHQCNLNECNSAGSTALHFAVQYKNSKVVNILLQNSSPDMKCNPHPTDNKGVTPLEIAYKKKYFTIVQLLLEKGTSPTYPNRERVIKDAEKLTKGNLFLHVHSWNNTTIAENILNSDWYRSGSAKVKYTKFNGDTLLHVSARNGHYAMVKLLVESNNCDLNVKNYNGETPLQVACKHAKIACIPIIADHTLADSSMLLHNAVRMGNIDILKALLCAKTVDLNEYNDLGETALHVACQEGILECIKLLASNKRCDVDRQNKTGDTALHIAIQGNFSDQINITKYLIENARCNPTIADADGNTPLHLACNRGSWSLGSNMVTIVRLLLSTGKVDPECINNVGKTPRQLAIGNRHIIMELDSFADTKLKHPIQSYLKLFFMGNAYAGKSTLVKAICTEASKLRKFVPSSKYKQVTGIEPLTAGIVPLAFRSKHFGNVILYDFAGQHEYYSSHAAVLENLVLSSPPTFLLVFNLSESTDCIREELAYWWSFIDSHCKKTSVTPHVILIGSHKDIVKSEGENAKDKMALIIKSMKEIPAEFHIAGHLSLDCRNLVSNGLSELHTILDKTCKIVRESVNIDLRCHTLHAFLTDQFHHRVACKVIEVQAAILTWSSSLPQNPTDLEILLSILSDQDQILYLKSEKRFEESWIVLQRQTLLSEVNGSIFAPEQFKQHIKDFAQSTGVVPLSRIKKHFPKYDPDVIVGALAHLEFCFKIEDYQSLHIFSSVTDSEPQGIDYENEQFYFFPALVRVKNPTGVWKENSQMVFQCGWFYECIHPYQFLTTRFLHVLILRLAFSFALAVDHTSSEECPVIRRRCSIWKNGIAWWNRHGIETIVEVGLQRHWVVVMMRCAIEEQMACVQLRSAVIKSILDTKDHFCNGIMMSEYLISPSSAQYPFEKKDEMALYSLKEVATTVVMGQSHVIHDFHDPIQLTELLPFEPYFAMNKAVMQRLFCDQYSQVQVTNDDLAQIAEGASEKTDLFKSAIKPKPSEWHECCQRAGNDKVLLCRLLLQIIHKRESGTFRAFQEQLSKFSIFCGRNPLDVGGVPLPDEVINIHPADDQKESADASVTAARSSLLQQPTEEVDDNPLGISDLHTISSSLVEMIPKWHDLGLSLGISPTTLTVIKIEHSKDTPRCMTETLAAWLQKQGNDIPSWRALVIALKSPAVGRENIALRITREHDFSPTDSTMETYQDVDNTQLDTEDLADVRDEVLTLHNWFHLGLALGLSYHRLKGIEADNLQSIESCRTEALNAWLRKQDMVSERGQPSWRTLAQALNSPLVGKPEVANMFSTTHSIT